MSGKEVNLSEIGVLWRNSYWLFLECANKCFVTQHVTDLTTDNSLLDLTVCTVVQDCCKCRSNKYRKWHFCGSCRPETP